MTYEEIEMALKDRAYDIHYGDNNDKWIIPKDKLTQETLVYINRLKEACQTAIESFTRMETLYKVKCTELECRQEQIRKETAKEIFRKILDDCRGLIFYDSIFEEIQALADDNYGIRVMQSDDSVEVE